MSVTPRLEFEALKPLPCGCVVAMHRTLHPDLRVVSLEAKGPYCGDTLHRTGWTSALPVPLRTDDEGFSELARD